MGGNILREETQTAPADVSSPAKHAQIQLGTNFLTKPVVPMALIAMDGLIIVLSTFIAIFLRSAVFPGLFGFDAFSPVRNYLSLWPALVLLVLARAAFGLYPGYGLHPAEELKRQSLTTMALILVVLGGSALFQFAEVYSRFVLAVTALLLLLGLPLARSAIKSALQRTRYYGEHVWIVGESDRARELSLVMDRNPALGLRFAGESKGVPINDRGVRHCLVVPEGLDTIPLADLLDNLNERFDRVWLAPNLLDVASVWVTPRDLQGHLALELRNNLLEPSSRVAKRLTDIFLCVVGLPVTLPLMLIISTWIRATDGGSVFIRQVRIGKKGQQFKILKFRTMHKNAAHLLDGLLDTNPHAKVEWEKTRKLRNDPRVTKPGRFLRRSSLDELPQIINVLAGQMSLVGPRPVMSDEVVRYGPAARLYGKVQPGITGLTQVSGRSELSYDERVRLDTYYVRNWSIWLDLVILGRTLAAVVTGRGAF